VLVPVEHLVNGVSIVQCEAVERVAYFHVELDSHDVIVTDGRDLCRLQPADVPQRRPVRRSLSRRGRAALGLLRAAPRRRPESRGGVAAARPARRHHGSDWPAGKAGSTLRRQGWSGWARDAANSNMPVPVEVVVDGVVLGSTLANHYRADLATAGYGDGRHGIEFRFPVPLASDRLHCLLPGAQPIGPRSPARRDCCRAPQPESAVQLKVGSPRKKE
jgi:hypothetical protein